jgi:hypothetical protein
VAAGITKARAMVDDLEEGKAVEALGALLAREDLTPPEVAAASLWRGVALLGLNQSGDAVKAFQLSRGCQPGMEPPAGLSPKVKQMFKEAAPGVCPGAEPPAPGEFATWDPSVAVARAEGGKGGSAPVAARSPSAAGGEGTATKAGGPKPKLLAGGAVAAVGAGVLVAALLAGVAALGSLVVSFPVVANAQAAVKAKDARNQGALGLGLRLGGAFFLVVASLGVLASVGALGAGAVVAVLGLKE